MGKKMEMKIAVVDVLNQVRHFLAGEKYNSFGKKIKWSYNASENVKDWYQNNCKERLMQAWNPSFQVVKCAPSVPY